MSVRQIEATGAAPPPVVWQRYAELARWPTWSPQIARVAASDDRLRLGVHGSVCVAHLTNVPFVVTAVDPVALTWSWIARLGPVPLTLHHAVLSAGSGTRSTLVLEGPAPVLAAYAPLAWLALRRLVRP